MLVRKRQLVGKIEDVEGVAETLAATDAKLLVYNQQIEFDPQMFTKNPLRATLSKLGRITGKKTGSAQFSFLLAGSGSISSQPEWVKYLRACGMGINILRTITIGAITNGPLLHGETVTGGTSNATGRVIKKTVTGTTTLYIVVLSGTFQSGELLTGGTSGATATTASTASQVGFALEPISSAVPSMTLAVYEDGMRKMIKGARGTVKFSFKSGEPVMVECSFSGVEAGVVDLDLLTGITYEDVDPPVFLGAQFTISGTSLNLSEYTLDMSSVLAPREDVTDARGVKSYMITGRDPVGTCDPEMVLAASHDFYDAWFSNAKMEQRAAFGTVSGNKFEFYGKAIQYTKIDEGDRDGIQLAQCTFDYTGSLNPGDDEVAVLIL
jgi:hypothetical protein